MPTKTGRYAIIEQFLADGIEYMFGNPGTVEQGFLDAIESYPALHYILTLQESIAVATADGYARATKRPTVVQLHSGVGLGNGVGMLYQAMRGHAPLVVIAGESGVRYDAMDAQMAADLVGIAKPVTKWATRVLDPASLLRVLRRAIKIAATPPMGPVFVALPMDILDAPAVESVEPTSIPSTRVIPDDGLIADAARLLAGATKPMLFVGDGIAYSDAQDELARVAELLGAEVWEADAGEVNISYEHPLYQGMTGHMFGAQSLPITSKGDVSLICGTYVLPEVFPELDRIFAPGARVIHIDLNLYEIAKNFPVDLGMLGDPKVTLGRLADVLAATMTSEQKSAANERSRTLAQAKEERRKAEVVADSRHRDAVPLQMSRFAQELAAQVPAETIIFDEALTNSSPLTRYLPPKRTGQYFLTRGGSLGVGIPGAIGAKLAHPDKPAFGFTGDGGAMYTIQALWSAARHAVDAKFVVCNNRSYRLLQLNIDQYWKERQIPKHSYPTSFDLSFPTLHFADMARSMGVPAIRVEEPEKISPAIRQALATPGPFLIDLVLEGDVHPELIGVKCGQ